MKLSDDAAVQPPPPAGDRNAEFTRFMRKYQDMVYSVAVRLSGNDAQAEDIAQEVFLRAHRRFEDLKENPRAAGWLKTVATNLPFTPLSRYRKRWVFFSQLQSQDEDGDAPEHEFPSTDPVTEEVQDDERHEFVEAALRALPEHQRVPLVLFHFEEMPYEEIATKLRVSLPKVKTDIHRARLALAGILARRGITAAQLEA